MTKAKEAESLKSNHKGINDNKLPVQTPWLAATKWLERFDGEDMEKLMDLTEKPKSNDMFLTAVWKEVGEMFKEYHDGLKDMRERDWDRFLCWLNSATRASVSSSPMNIYLKRKTVERYAAYWQRFLCFCFRTMDDLPWQTDGVGGFKFTVEQGEASEKV